MKLIPKDAVLAVIDKFKHKDYIPYERELFELVCDIESSVNSLEVTEVDLDKEIKNYNMEYVDDNGFFDTEHFAKHFFELGVNASNPLTWEDIETIGKLRLEVALELRRKELDSSEKCFTEFPIEDYCKEVLKRFKTQKGE